ncbi:DNA polymerase III subunit gamma and tau, partial [Streptomyces goshikiensis]
MSDSPLPGAWPAPDLGEPAWPGPAPAYDPAAAGPDPANAVPIPRRGARRREAPEPPAGPGGRGRPSDATPEPLPGTGRRGRPAPPDAVAQP